MTEDFEHWIKLHQERTILESIKKAEYPKSEIDKLGSSFFIRTWEEMDHDGS